MSDPANIIHSQFTYYIFHLTKYLYMITHKRKGKTRRKEDKDKEEDIKAIGLEEEWSGLEPSLCGNLHRFRISYTIT